MVLICSHPERKVEHDQGARPQDECQRPAKLIPTLTPLGNVHTFIPTPEGKDTTLAVVRSYRESNAPASYLRAEVDAL